MKKAIIIFLVLAVVCLAFFSCYNDVTFCYYCGSRNIKEDGKESGIQMYKCNACGERFGAQSPF